VRFLQQGKCPARLPIPVSRASVAQRLRAAGHSWTLTTQILLASLSLLLTVVLGGFLFTLISNQTLDRQYQLRALGIATTTAQVPEIRSALAAGDPKHIVDGLAQEITAAAQSAYVVVTDRNGIWFSHPNPALIGHKLEEPVAVLDGKTHLGFDQGSLGTSANAKAPIFGADGSVIGQVSVCIQETKVLDNQVQNIWLITRFSALVLALGVAVSLLLSRRIRRVTFNLEPAEIASVSQEREALLHGIREAVVGLDDDGRVTVTNGEARRLLQIEGAALGEPVAELKPDGRLRDLLTGKLSGANQVALTEDALLVVNRMPVSTAGRSIGSVLTLRDRTEIEALVRDLHSIQGLMEAMRALEHEYANRLHIVDGLLEMGEVDQAKSYVSELSSASRSLGEGLRASIAPPELAALLLAKITVAAEQDVQIELLTIVGNLLDNAMDALANTPRPRTVTVQFDDADGIFIAVRDNGPGVPAEKIDQVVVDGYSTKDPRPGMRRGIGLALVRRIVHRAGGTRRVPRARR
jgi:two-component system CitB family sensor kinase